MLTTSDPLVRLSISWSRVIGWGPGRWTRRDADRWRGRMPGPAPQAITVTARQQRVLERLVRRATSPQRQVRRAQIILAAAAGANNEQVGRQVGVSEQTARLWRGRWAAASETVLAAEAEGDERALDAVLVGVLMDEFRPGAPATFT